MLKGTVLVVLLLDIFGSHEGKKIAMKIVDEPTNYGMNNYGGYQNQQPETDTLKMRVTPSNFSGPPHLKRLIGKCFSKSDSSYKYEFCPFSNVTQHEQSLRWNPYSGVLGVWQEWEIENNTFVAFVMREGDKCGSVSRSVRVLPRCGNSTSLGNISEPATCQYQAIFYSPLVCHPQSLLVYPTLSHDLQNEWDLVEGLLQSEQITQKGYKKRVNRIFEKAGYVLSQEKREAITAEAKRAETKRDEETDFETLYSCTEAHKKLKTEVKRLQALLTEHGISYENENDVAKPDAGHHAEDTDINMDYPVHDEYEDNYNHYMEKDRY